MERKNKLIVLKVGTSSLTGKGGQLSAERLRAVADGVAAIRAAGHTVILVTSGAVAAGFSRLGFAERPISLPAKQASAAVGQGLLIQAYTAALAQHNIPVAQLLLTRADFTDRRRYGNVFNTFNVLFKRGALPVINENDSVSIEELRFGDNDRLSAQVAALVHADSLIILTDVGGLYDSNPAENPAARRIPVVDEIDDRILAMAGGSGSAVGTGGMRSKIEAARIATFAGVPVTICGPTVDEAVAAATKGGAGTLFTATEHALNTRRQWVAFHSDAAGQLVIDDGAVEALTKRHTSLLPSGIGEVRGDFAAGDVVDVTDRQGGFVGRGIVRYSAVELRRVKGLKTPKIREILGDDRAEAIHRDDWLGVGKKQREEQ